MTNPKRRERHPPRQSAGVLVILGAVAALLAALVLITGVLVQEGAGGSLPSAGADPPSTTPSQAASTSAASAPFATDDRGFLNSDARCQGAQYAVAIGRTRRSLVVICTDPEVTYEYRGLRIGDGAVLTLTAQSDGDGGFLAQNDGVTYAVTPKQLLVTSGETVVDRQTMLDYQEPHLAAEAAPSQQASPTTTPTAPAPQPGG